MRQEGRELICKGWFIPSSTYNCGLQAGRYIDTFLRLAKTLNITLSRAGEIVLTELVYA